MCVQREQGGQVGIVVDCIMHEPLTDSDYDQEAAKRGLALKPDHRLALDPLIFGEYPSEMRQFLGNQLPIFSTAETNFMKDSIDFIAVNPILKILWQKTVIHTVVVQQQPRNQLVVFY
ncbi:beta-glucosidase 18-like protein [Tanacetum coccineum]